MRSATVQTSDENFDRIIAALRNKLGDEAEALSDAQLWRFDLRGYYTELLYKYDRQQSLGTVAPDADVVEVT